MTRHVRELSARDRRALVVCAIVVLSALLVARALPAAIRWRRDTLTSAADAALRARRAVAISVASSRKPQASDWRERAAAELDSALLVANDPTTLGAELAETMKSLSENAGVTVASIEIESDTERVGPLRTASVRLDITADMDGLTTLLLSVEAGPRLLSVSELALSPTGSPQPGGTEPAIHAQMLIRGLGQIRKTAPRGSA